MDGGAGRRRLASARREGSRPPGACTSQAMGGDVSGRICRGCRRPRVPARTRLPAWASRLLCGWCSSCLNS
eukprot:1248028-Pyramimonas_sp.AAC.1